ncbi:MAG: rRNA adenine dimethyltransferase family protein, partial [Patescibacteria group bacterium]
MHSKKHLGQYFLKNPEILRILADSLNLKSGDLVIEIGPGHGELTEVLRMMNYLPTGDVPKGHELRIMGIEKDTELAMELKKKFQKNKNIEIICGDILKILPTIPHPYKLAGNIPYYITGHLLRIISELKEKPDIAVLTIQKEVAERICAVPPSMNLLAASVQVWARSKIIRTVSKNEFSPRPKVDSAVIKLITLPKNKSLTTEFY